VSLTLTRTAVKIAGRPGKAWPDSASDAGLEHGSRRTSPATG